MQTFQYVIPKAIDSSLESAFLDGLNLPEAIIEVLYRSGANIQLTVRLEGKGTLFSSAKPTTPEEFKSWGEHLRKELRTAFAKEDNNADRPNTE